jgi:hypothetical protein
MNRQKCKYTKNGLSGEAVLHGIKRQMYRGMNMQKCRYTKKRLSGEATLHGTVEAHTCTGTAVLTQISIAVHTCCRVAAWMCFRNETEKHTGKSAMKRIYKSIVIHS